MSVQRFCHHCGKGVQVGAKFCSFCGTNLLSLASTPTPPVVPKETLTPHFVANAEDDDDEGAIDRMTHLNLRQNKLQVEIVRDRTLVDTVGNVAKAGALAGKPEPFILERSQPFLNVDTKEFQQDFQKEAGTLRNEKK